MLSSDTIVVETDVTRQQNTHLKHALEDAKLALVNKERAWVSQFEEVCLVLHLLRIPLSCMFSVPPALALTRLIPQAAAAQKDLQLINEEYRARLKAAQKLIDTLSS
jgi:LAS superfamily LD-carboxypeptidase LdcB